MRQVFFLIWLMSSVCSWILRFFGEPALSCVSVFSSARIFSRIVVKLRTMAADFSQSACFAMGYTPVYSPGSKDGAPDQLQASSMLTSVSLRSGGRDLRQPSPMVQYLPIIALPAMPTQPAMAVGVR